MWAVAVDATALDRRVFEFYAGDSLSQFLVAFKTEGIPAFSEIELVLFRVGVVAFNTFALCNDLVRTDRFLRDQF